MIEFFFLKKGEFICVFRDYYLKHGSTFHMNYKYVSIFKTHKPGKPVTLLGSNFLFRLNCQFEKPWYHRWVLFLSHLQWIQPHTSQFLNVSQNTVTWTLLGLLLSLSADEILIRSTFRRFFHNVPLWNVKDSTGCVVTITKRYTVRISVCFLFFSGCINYFALRSVGPRSEQGTPLTLTCVCPSLSVILVDDSSVFKEPQTISPLFIIKPSPKTSQIYYCVRTHVSHRCPLDFFPKNILVNFCLM